MNQGINNLLSSILNVSKPNQVSKDQMIFSKRNLTIIFNYHNEYECSYFEVYFIKDNLPVNEEPYIIESDIELYFQTYKIFSKYNEENIVNDITYFLSEFIAS